MSWTWNAPSGTYKNHFMSGKIRHAAVADSHFMKFMTAEPGYGKGKGDTVNITRFDNLPLAGKVSELDRLPSGKPPITVKSVTVSEWGYKVPMTEFEENLSHYDIRNHTQRSLRDQMRLTCDKMCADALKLTPIKAYSTDIAAATIVSTGTMGNSTVGFTLAHLRDIYDYMYGTLKIPPTGNGRYIGILAAKTARQLKGSAGFADVWGQTDRRMIQNPLTMIPDVEGFDIYVTNHFDALSNSPGALGNTGEAVFFGADAGFLAEVQTPELRAGPKEDLGRFSDVGWVGTLEASLVWDQATKSRVVHWGDST